jgi:hypothetical protein
MKIEEQDVKHDQYTDDFVDEYALSPAQEQQIEIFQDNATIAIFSEKSQPQILQLLQTDMKNPMKSVGYAAFMVLKSLVFGSIRSSEPVTEVTLMFGGAHLVSELITLAEAAGLYQLTDQERLDAFGEAIKLYLEEGFKIFKEQGSEAPGAVDPIEIQKAAEYLLSDEQRQSGMQMARENEISLTQPPKVASPGMAQEQPQTAQTAQQGLLGGAM